MHPSQIYPDMLSRFAVLPHRGCTGDTRWFEEDLTFLLHFANAYEKGSKIVLDDFFEG